MATTRRPVVPGSMMVDRTFFFNWEQSAAFARYIVTVQPL